MAKKKRAASSYPTAKQLADERDRRKLTQTEAAGMLGISLRMWQYYESGKAKKPPSEPVAILLWQFVAGKKISQVT